MVRPLMKASVRGNPAQPSEFEAREQRLRDACAAEYDRFAAERDAWRAKNAAYYKNIEKLVRFVVPTGANVLEIGSGTGDLLASLQPKQGLGIDISPRLVDIARKKHPHLDFAVADVETLDAPELNGRTFDYVVMADVVGSVLDVWNAFRAVRRLCHARTRIIITYYNFVWEPILRLAERLGRKMPISQQNWLGREDIENLLELNHFEIIRSGTAQLLPADVPVVSTIANRYLAQSPVTSAFALTQF